LLTAAWELRLMRSLHSEGLGFLRRGPFAVWPVVLEAGSAKPISVRHDVRCDGAVRLGNRSPVRRCGTLKMPRHAALGRTTAVPDRRVCCRAAYGDCRRSQSDCYVAKHDVNQTRRPVLGLRSSVGKPLQVCGSGRLYFFPRWGYFGLPLAKDVPALCDHAGFGICYKCSNGRSLTCTVRLLGVSFCALTRCGGF
jgi:hypothetical protein